MCKKHDGAFESPSSITTTYKDVQKSTHPHTHIDNIQHQHEKSICLEIDLSQPWPCSGYYWITIGLDHPQPPLLPSLLEKALTGNYDPSLLYSSLDLNLDQDRKRKK
ncbi:unnamed protein product [Lactuca virosa]|uniref:Uncharacterized protein n=1 Tax=Lactuca virosa TaxID=75947 RepID=A0AAU9LVW7_9ASTR|nr:unnamed protein product [Lactuca virosa]